MTSFESFVEVADRIGRRLLEQALWDGDTCTWEVVKTEHGKPLGSTRRVPADGTMYQGTAGIGMFLTELHRRTGNLDYADAAGAALRHSLGTARDLSPRLFGLYSGRVGVALAAVRCAETLGSPLLRKDVEEVLEPLLGKVHEDRGLDVIAGAAGAIPALLEIGRTTEDDRWTKLAVALGDHLVRTAYREPRGWSWSPGYKTSPFYVRRLTGMAHGAAGFGLALTSLYEATGDERFRFFARNAFSYEDQFFRPEEDNWLDLQHNEIARHLTANDLDGLRDRIRGEDRPPPYEERCHTAWCHGAPGIAIARLYASAVLSDKNLRIRADQALRCTRRLVSSGDPFSLCHGRAGNCEALIYGSQILDDPWLLEAARDCGRDGWDRFEARGRPWHCGTVGGQRDPSLMLGEAGIGYFFLRLASLDTPSVLLALNPMSRGSIGDRDPAAIDVERRAYGQVFFARTLKALDATADPQKGSGVLIRGWRRPGLVGLRQGIEAELQALPDTRAQRRLRDVYTLEAAIYEAAESPRDFAEQFMDELGRVPPLIGEVDGRRFELGPTVRLVSTRWDWDRWMDGEAVPGDPPAPPPGPVHYAIHQRHANVSAIRLDPLAASMLRALQDRFLTVDQIVDEVGRALDWQDEPDILRSSVVSQMAEAHVAGLLRVASSLPDLAGLQG